MDHQASTLLPILVVDDEKNYRIIMNRILSGAGYRVLTADHWQEAIRLLKQQPVALVLSDMHMPEVDGLTLCKLVSKDIGQVPFILFSACLSASSRQEISATVDAWGSLSKPFNNQDVLSLIEEVLKTSTSRPKATINRIGKKPVSKKLYAFTEDQESS